ncbi:4'-phosphopantetheinyl transferase family protein [Angustibacter aerolatus]
MLRQLLPEPWLHVAESDVDLPGELHPDEAAHVARAIERRRREFVTGRVLARQALRSLGVAPAPLPRGERGAPAWPLGVVGSITHCDGYRGAAVAAATECAAVGVDAEPAAPLPDGVLATVATPRELAAPPDVEHWGRLLFSAKESVYKAWFPLTGRWLGFEDVEVALASDGTFTARLLVPGPVVDGRELPELPGRWRHADGLLGTAVLLPR